VEARAHAGKLRQLGRVQVGIVDDPPRVGIAKNASTAATGAKRGVRQTARAVKVAKRHSQEYAVPRERLKRDQVG